ncbi:MAG TPA: TonB family protein, partial [Polyangiaceae bacterium LLY-WYZ-15_(1-7)]|nr:TonB family protein [Polyangiaceae bacterium LLY-WYZ-15_(1-7)]
EGEGQGAVEPPELEPPRLLEFVEADYPSGAEEEGIEATVELELTIAVDGAVTDARVVGPAGNGFDEAALDAVRRFRFEPAKRRGEPIPARIRYRYVFELAEEVPPPPQETDEPEAPAPGRIEGRVLGMEDGQPIQRAEVVLTNADQSIARRSVAGEDGTFRFDELPPGRYTLVILADEFGELTQEEEVVSNEITDVTYRMRLLEADEGEENFFGATAVIDPPPREVTRRTIPREQLTRIPGTRGDALRAIEVLPGVARPPFGTGQLIIRGSSPQDSQVFIEGIPVPQLYHFGGLTSIFNSRLLDRIDFFPGNFSVRYGRKTGGVVEVGVRDPLGIHPQRGIHGVAEFGVIDVSLLGEFPLGENAEAAFGIRRSMIDIVFDQLVPEDLLSVTAAPVYYDYQSIITWRPTDRDRLRLLVYGSSDRFGIVADEALGDDPAIRGNLDLTSRFHFVHFDYDRQVDDQTELDLDLQVGTINLEFGAGDFASFDARFNQIFGRAELRHRPNSRVRLIAGMDIFSAPLTLNYFGPAPQQSEGNPGGDPASTLEREPYTVDAVAYRPAMYFESDLQPWEPLKLILGMRVDYAREIDRWSFDPRMAAVLEVVDDFKIRGGVGIFSQPPEFQETAEGLGNQDLDFIHSVHTGLGFDWVIDQGIRLSVDGFYKRLWDRVVGTENGVPPRFTNGGIGRIYGMEVSGRIDPIDGRRFFGYLSYTLSRSERQDREGDDWRLFDFDQTHIFTLVGAYKLPRGWEVGVTLRLVSGNPTTPIVGSAQDLTSGTYFPIYGRVNSERNPLFNRLDLRIEKQWIFESWKLALFLDIQNVYNQQNQEGYIYNYDYTQRTPINGLPFIPALGIRGEL